MHDDDGDHDYESQKSITRRTVKLEALEAERIHLPHCGKGLFGERVLQHLQMSASYLQDDDDDDEQMMNR